ncbi:MAG: hypothetical protein FWD57_03900 [Polyangiaceae bacterium]|nr:hypothetical protein [Polyangiaceae bacterium]
MGKQANGGLIVERRRHRVLLTRNSEYHFRDGLCVAVRNRRTGEWLPDHIALMRTVSGLARRTSDGGYSLHEGRPAVGESIRFGGGGREYVSGPLLEERRPEKYVVDEYPAGLCGMRLFGA